jgi:3-deoxy-D-manno-octulosonic-acid transferase
VVGPHMENFREIADLFAGGDALLQVASEQELAELLLRFAAAPELFEATGRRGLELLDRFRGASDRNASVILAATRRQDGSR